MFTFTCNASILIRELTEGPLFVKKIWIRNNFLTHPKFWMQIWGDEGVVSHQNISNFVSRIWSDRRISISKAEHGKIQSFSNDSFLRLLEGRSSHLILQEGYFLLNWRIYAQICVRCVICSWMLNVQIKVKLVNVKESSFSDLSITNKIVEWL